MERARPYSCPIAIEASHIDRSGRVEDAQYLRWVQDAVVAHWRAVAPPAAVAAYLWVALAHTITYRKPAVLKDDIVATVTVEKVQGARAFYETLIKRGDEVIADIHSTWCCLDATTLRPARLARDVVECFVAGR